MRYGEHWDDYPPDDPPEPEQWCSECASSECSCPHCDNCGRLMHSPAEIDDGVCMTCQIEWMARHQLPAPSGGVDGEAIDRLFGSLGHVGFSAVTGPIDKAA